MRPVFIPLAGALAISFGAAAQSTTSEPLPPLSTYVRVIQGDSVHLFYRHDYAMVQPACAVIRRQVRLDTDGSFKGRFRDYRTQGDSLVQAGSYANGKKQGTFSSYHRNGKLAARGQYVADKPSGVWQYWYASGQQQQVLHFGADGRPKVVEAWAPDGRQTVTDGTGTWQGQLSTYLVGGPVVKGLPDGHWESKSREGKTILAETFANGQFKAGRQLVSFPGTLPTYKDASRLSIVEPPVFCAAEGFRLQPPCRPAAARPAAADARRFAPATYKQGLNAYTELLWLRLRDVVNGTTPLAEYYGVLSFTLHLDAAGDWGLEPEQVKGNNEAAAKELLGIMRRLPRWQPARLDGQPVASRVEITLQALRPNYNLNLTPGAALTGPTP